MPDVSIVNTTVTGTPDDYTVPGTQELFVKAVRATFDGTGAAGSFLPALQLLDPAGHVMWTAVNNQQQLAAGASADVSWFPGVSKSAGSSSTGAGWTLGTLSAAAIVTVNAGTTKIINMANTPFYTNASSVFTVGTKVIGGTTYTGLGILADGHYLGKAQVQVAGFSAANSGAITVLWEDEPGSVASYGSAGSTLNCTVAVSSGNFDPYLETISTVSGGSSDIWLIQVNNTTAVNITAYVDMMAVQLDTNTTRIF